MKYAIVFLLCSGMWAVQGKLLIRKPDCKAGNAGNPPPESRCEEDRGKCFKDTCFWCTGIIIPDGLCDNPQKKCCAPVPGKGNTCENLGGECLDTNVYGCIDGFKEKLCPDDPPHVKCCFDGANECERAGHECKAPGEICRREMDYKCNGNDKCCSDDCERTGGKCRDLNTFHCRSGYVRFLCKGQPDNIRCCYDSVCAAKGGRCLHSVLDKDLCLGPVLKFTDDQCSGPGWYKCCL